MLTDVMCGPVIPWHSCGRIDPFSFLTWMLDFSSSHCTLCQLVSVPVLQVFSQRGSFEGDFPQVQRSRNANNCPSKIHSNGSIPLSLLRPLLLVQMKEEEGVAWRQPQSHNVPVHIFQSGNLCLCSGMKGCGRQPRGDFSC